MPPTVPISCRVSFSGKTTITTTQNKQCIDLPGLVAQSVTCLATDACLTADQGVASSIPVRSHTFVEIDHVMISTAILLPSTDSFKGCCQLQAKVCARIILLVNRLFKPAQEKVLLTWDVKQQKTNKQCINSNCFSFKVLAVFISK